MRTRALAAGLAVALIAAVAATPASALPRTISWASPPGPGGPFPATFGVEAVNTNGVSDVCGNRREKIDPGLQTLFGASTSDGSRAFFSTEGRLSALDVDTDRDVYEFSAGTTKLVSPGASGDQFLLACSTDGSRVFFHNGADLFQHTGGTTAQVNVSETGELNDSFVDNVAISADGTKVAFDTTESLTGDDADTFPPKYDVFQRSGSQTDLVSTPGTANVGTLLAGISADGSRIYMNSNDQLAGNDPSTSADVYVSQNLGPPTVVSIDTTTGNAAGGNSFFRGATPDGGHVFFTTSTAIDSDDDGSDGDIYDRNGSATTWISEPAPGRPEGFSPFFSFSSPNAERVYFTSEAQLTATDSDSQSDLYLKAGTSLVHITRQVPGAAAAGTIENCSELGVARGCASLDGTRYFLSSSERLVAADNDSAEDIYRFTAPSGPLELVSGTGTAVNRLGGASANGLRAVFTSDDRLQSCRDGDTSDSDVYEWDNGALRLVTPQVGTGQQGNILSAISSDAATIFFTSNGRYAGADNDGQLSDLFAARPGGPSDVCPGAAAPRPVVGAKDTTAPRATLSGAKTQKAGSSVSVTVKCNEACVVNASGTVSVPGAAKVFKLGKARKSIRAGGRAKLKLKVSTKTRRAIRKALRRKRKVRATIKLRIADSAGNSRRSSRKIRLKR